MLSAVAPWLLDCRPWANQSSFGLEVDGPSRQLVAARHLAAEARAREGEA